VVISIIGVLSTIAMTSLNGARAKARDAARLSQINQLRNVLEIYYTQYGTYPDNTDTTLDVGCWWAWDAGNILNSGDTFLSQLVSSGIVDSVPIEKHPISGGECSYRYVKTGPPCASCTQSYAVLYTSLETASDPVDERPDCLKGCWGEGGSPYDYAIFLSF